MNKKPADGWTLIELLVVVGITITLTILLFPTFKQMLAESRQSVCLGNLRSYGSGLLALVADQGGLPPVTNATDVDFDGKLVPQYVSKTLRCPLANQYTNISKQSGFYAGNGSLCELFPHLNNLPVASSHVILAAESYWPTEFSSYSQFNYTIWGSQEYPPTSSSEGSYRQPIYHGSPTSRGLNVFFLDGSAACIHAEQNDWFQKPTYGDATNGGYFYHHTQFVNMKNGKSP